MSLNIQLEKDTFYPGESVKGVLVLEVSKPLRAREVVLSFIGKEHTRVERGGGKNRSVYIGEQVIVENYVSLWVASSPKGHLGPCHEIFPFEFQIPPNALPSMVVKFNDVNSISYELKAKIDRPLAIDPNYRTQIHVTPIPIDTYPTNKMVGTLEEPTGKDYIEVVVDKNVFIPGERVSGRVTFRRDPVIKVRAVECSVLFEESATAQGRTDTFPYIIGRHRWDLYPGQESFEWAFNFPTLQSDDFSVGGELIKRIWMVDVKVDLPLKRDQHVKIPLLFLPLRAPVYP